MTLMYNVQVHKGALVATRTTHNALRTEVRQKKGGGKEALATCHTCVRRARKSTPPPAPQMANMGTGLTSQRDVSQTKKKKKKTNNEDPGTAHSNIKCNN